MAAFRPLDLDNELIAGTIATRRIARIPRTTRSSSSVNAFARTSRGAKKRGPIFAFPISALLPGNDIVLVVGRFLVATAALLIFPDRPTDSPGADVRQPCVRSIRIG